MRLFSGVITALATPFKSGKLDLNSYRKLLHQQISSGVQGFIVNGTTGESPTLLADEVAELYRLTRNELGEKCPIVIGTGSNSTAKTIESTKRAEDLGADAALVVVPYYNKPPQEGLVEHFSAVARAVQLPILLYNVPGRTITALGLDAIVELAKIKNVVGIKEASGDVAFAKKIRERVGPEFVITSGDDATCVEMCEAAGDGVISVVSHIIPNEFVKAIGSAHGKVGAGRAFLKINEALFNSVYAESNPIGIKMALHLMGIFESPELRLPLVRMSKGATATLQGQMKARGLIP